MVNDNWPIFFYKTRSGNSPIEDFLDDLSGNAAAHARKEMALLVEFGPFELGMPHVRHLEDKLWELRIRGKNQHRIIFFIFHRREIILLHGFSKKRNQIAKRHIKIARQRMIDIIKHYGGD